MRKIPAARMAPELVKERSPPREGARECRVPSAPAASCAKGSVECTRVHSGRTGNHPASPHAMVLTASFVISPAIGSFATVACSVLTANLTPASRRQDHTTSPSASALSSKAPLASIASRPASVTMASAPRVGRDGGIRKVICGFGKPEYFFERGWTTRANHLPHRSRRRADAVRWHRNMNPYFPRVLHSRLVRQPRMRYADGLLVGK